MPPAAFSDHTTRAPPSIQAGWVRTVPLAAAGAIIVVAPPGIPVTTAPEVASIHAARAPVGAHARSRAPAAKPRSYLVPATVLVDAGAEEEPPEMVRCAVPPGLGAVAFAGRSSRPRRPPRWPASRSAPAAGVRKSQT
ncbi:hypothetical protein ACFQ9X_55285 [Catenulispora yoronensis]